MRRLKTLCIAFPLAFACLAWAGNPDFSGAWTLNETKSALGEGGGRMIPIRVTVVQTADTLSIERLSRRPSGEERTVSEKLSFDGKECLSGAPERPRTSSAKWSEDGKSLVVSSKTVFERDGNQMEITSVETWKRSDDGKTLTLDIVSQSPRSERKATAVYDKAP
jgi:hypothetical protein